jgi:hypothetical protein
MKRAVTALTAAALIVAIPQSALASEPAIDSDRPMTLFRWSLVQKGFVISDPVSASVEGLFYPYYAYLEQVRDELNRVKIQLQEAKRREAK